MGLDSIELIMEVEKYFGISIPDSEAEKVYTVQAMVDTVARHLNVIENTTELRDVVFERVSQTLLKLALSDTPATLTDDISRYLSPANKQIWAAFEKELRLDVPKPDIVVKEKKNLIGRVTSAIMWTPMYDWHTITVEQFVTAICAYNWNELIVKEHIKSTYEIYVAVTAITVDKIGVDYYEITPGKSFTADLGVD